MSGSTRFQLPVLVTNSSMRAFLTCEQSYVFRYVMWIKTRSVSMNLTVGTAFHAGMVHLLDQKLKEGSRIEQAMLAVDKIFDAVAERTDAPNLDHAKIQYGRCQASAMLCAWNIVFGEKVDAMNIVATEIPFSLKDDITMSSPKEDRLGGVIDGLEFDDSTVLRVIEHKTRASLSNMEFVAALPLDQQCMFYLILTERYLRENQKELQGLYKKRLKKKAGEFTVGGFHYDAVAKPLHRSGNSFEELKDRMMKAMMEDQDKYFFNYPIPVSSQTVALAKNDLFKVIDKMDHLTLSNTTMNRAACYQYGKGGCEYQVLCRNGARAADPESVLAMPEMAGFTIVPPHEEITDGEVEE